ncbi:MAG: ectoine synthase [Candidatus Methylomirabilis sp.]|nr:ectoine synthase [Deltaproteobacteria bacterium]
MIVRKLSEVEGTGRRVDTPNWTSRRLLLAGDGMGFSLHDTVIRAGTETCMWYRNHLEAVYCVEGEGEIEALADGAVHEIAPGTMYALDAHDKHRLRARTEMRLVCVFNPPVTGREVHDESGAYPIAADGAAGKETETR